MPDDWAKKYKDMDTKDYVHHKKNVFPVPPCFLYLHDMVRVLSREPILMHKSMDGEKPAFGSYWLVHKDKNGNIHKTNLKAFMEKVDGGEIVFNEYMGKSEKANDWHRHAKQNRAIRNAIASTVGHGDSEAQGSRDEHLKAGALRPSTISAAGSLLNIQHMRQTGRQWGKGKSSLQSALANVSEISYYNSEVEKRGYRFKIDPRTRGSTSSISRPMLQSVYSESRFIKTQSTFLNPPQAQSVVKFRVDKNPVVMRGTRSSAGFYADRLPERDQQAAREPQPNIQVEAGAAGGGRGEAAGDGVTETVEKDPFAEWEEKQKEEESEQERVEEELNAEAQGELGSLREEVPIPFSQSNFRTTQNYFTNYRERPENITYAPKIHDLGTSSLRQAMHRTSSSKFFASMNKEAGSIFSKKIDIARSTANLPAVASSKTLAAEPDTLSRYNRLKMRTAADNTRSLLSKRATRDSAREYEEMVHSKARLSANFKNQSMESLKRALITPDTTLYQDITQLPIPCSGTRLLSFESKAKDGKPKKSKNSK